MLKTTGIFARAALIALAVAAPTALLTAVAVPPAMAQGGPDGEVDLETFYRELSPHGTWFQHRRYGEVWRPDVPSGWRPYTRGHWAWTDEHGWYWVAEEEWGWGPFHYGRWVFDDNEEEWLWIPGYEWAPAWVQWRESEDVVGWAPLPPDSLLDGGTLRFNQTYYDSPRFSNYWVFAAPAVMFLPGLYRHILPTSRHSTVWRSTRHVHHNHHFDRGRIYMPGVDHRRVERWAGRPVPPVTLRPVTSPRDNGWRRMESQNVVPVYRPRVVSRPDVQRPDRPIFGAPRGGDRPIVVTPGTRRDGGDRGSDRWSDRGSDRGPGGRGPYGDRDRDGIPNRFDPRPNQPGGSPGPVLRPSPNTPPADRQPTANQPQRGQPPVSAPQPSNPGRPGTFGTAPAPAPQVPAVTPPTNRQQPPSSAPPPVLRQPSADGPPPVIRQPPAAAPPPVASPPNRPAAAPPAQQPPPAASAPRGGGGGGGGTGAPPQGERRRDGGGSGGPPQGERKRDGERPQGQGQGQPGERRRDGG